MKKYLIVTDSTTDLPVEYEENNDLLVLPMTYTLDGDVYKHDLANSELSVEDFYTKIKNGATSKTTQINPTDFYAIFEECVVKGYGVLGLFFSSGLSGTFNSARIAYEQILENYPDASIKIIDSLCASMGEGLLIHYAIKAQNSGMSLEDNASYIEELKHKISHWFTVMDMDTLKRGGRISASSAFFAKTLHINPVLNVSEEGKLVARMKKVGRKSAIMALADKFVETYDKDNNDVVFISHSESNSDVEYLKKVIEERTGMSKFVVGNIGPVIGSHCGAGTLALFYVSESR